MSGNVIATNKKAYHNFLLFDKWECGIALKGAEVKSIRAGYVNFKDSFALIEKGNVFLYNLHVNPYKEASYMNEEPDRVRQLLLNKKEIKKISGSVLERGMALVPTKLYFNNRGFVKIELALARGKKVFDKREDVKNRSIDRALKRVVHARRG